jgi:hypothetical protein
MGRLARFPDHKQGGFEGKGKEEVVKKTKTSSVRNFPITSRVARDFPITSKVDLKAKAKRRL